MFLSWVAALAAAQPAFATSSSQHSSKRRGPAQESPRREVSLEQRAPVCRAIAMKYGSTDWDHCRKARFRHTSKGVAITLATQQGEMNCQARFHKKRAKSEVSHLSCEPPRKPATAL